MAKIPPFAHLSLDDAETPTDLRAKALALAERCGRERDRLPFKQRRAARSRASDRLASR